MKKILLFSVIIFTLLFSSACGARDTSVDISDNTDNADNIVTDIEDADVNTDKICIDAIHGLNEQINISMFKPDSGDCVVSYKAAGADEFTVIDKELIIDDGNMLNCYIIGLKKGIYDVRIETGNGENFARATISGIDVEKQDRSGYAHFKREEGIGGYNNDGTVKENAKIIYLTNENKNTITLDINGTTYTGLVQILQANETMTEPLIIRVLDTITTNQWKPIEKGPRVSDYSVIEDDYFIKEFSDQYGENIIGLPITISTSQVDKQYLYTTTADGIVLSQVIEGEGNTYDGCSMNMIDVNNAGNITIEGVGPRAGFFQFGIWFHYSDSIEVRNLTVEQYPVDGLGFYAFGKVDQHGGYWIHNNTFKAGCNSWGEGDVDGDEPIDLADVNHVTFSYNKFYQTGKTMLLGGWEYDACLNVTFHHNYYQECYQRLPLSRNSNIHNYNNYYEDCARGLSPRSNSYVFGESNYFKGVGETYYISGTETWGAVKSWNEIYYECRNTEIVTVVSEREEYVENTCKPDEITDYSKFDSDPELFYYDVENKCSDVEIMHTAEEVPEFVKKHAGAGVNVRVDIE
ncbi:MAG: hypothetical protein IKT70_04580 [Clostridia bacterium]|nr:hypothetical protein [Clostridia bacterium]